MAFTDEDLKRIKIEGLRMGDISSEDFRALLNRLACAENVCSMFYPKERTHEEWVKESLDAHEAWRKSCGK